jgi:hypothetical protein
MECETSKIRERRKGLSFSYRMSVLMRFFSLWFQQSPEEQESITLADLEVIKVVGVGSSGKVEKVRHKRTHKIYALKVRS